MDAWGSMDPQLRSPALEGLIDFLTFLVPKLWPKRLKSIRVIAANPLGINQLIYGFLAMILAPETLESRSRAFKTRVMAYFPIKF